MFSTREDIRDLKKQVTGIFNSESFELINAMERTRGEDNYCKICEQILSTAFGVALITENTPPISLYNIYLEIGLLRAFGREVLILTPDINLIPSDLAGKGLLPYKSDTIREKIINWTSEVPSRIDTYKLLADIFLDEEEDYEKFFDYLQKAIMLGDFEDSIKKLNEVFLNPKKETKISNHLQKEVKRFLRLVKPFISK